MDQQINLFQPIFRKEKKLLSFRALIQIGVIAIISLLIIYVLAWLQITSLAEDLSILSDQQQIHLAQLEKANREMSRRDGDHTAEIEIRRLEAELYAEQYILTVLNSDRLGQPKGFSSYLEGFSRQVVKGMWLTGFKVTDGGNGMEISGRAIAASLLPKFLQRLSNEPALVGTEFSMMQIRREKPQHAWVDFRLYSGNAEKAGS